MKINKHLSRLQRNLKLSVLSSFIVIMASSSVFASSTAACVQNKNINASTCTMNKATCKKTTACKKSANYKKVTACKKASTCKTSAVPAVPATPAKSTPTAKPATTAPATKTPTTQTSNSVVAYENKVLDLVNVERQKAGLSPLKMDETLRNVARTKSQDMQTNHYFDHNSPTYGSPFDMMKKFGVSYTMAGENIAMGQKTPEEVVTAWMNSPGHRANILKPGYTFIGVGYVANGNYWTQEFIAK